MNFNMYNFKRKKIYFYHLSKQRIIDELFGFYLDLAKVTRVYSDEDFSYYNIYGNKLIEKKLKIINII